jgi:hypothetical protein
MGTYSKLVKSSPRPIVQLVPPEKADIELIPPVVQSQVPEIHQVFTSKSDETTQGHDTVIPRHHDTMTPRSHATMIESLRKAVREFGKEAATHRFTLEEKRAISDITYTYKALNIKTSENEIARIAINFLLHDYRENGEQSILDKVLRALHE